MRRPDRSRGFTLLEVLVAMTVVAVLATALLRLTADAVGAAGSREERALAAIVASNYLVELRQGGVWPQAGRLGKTVEMAGRSWHIDAEAQSTGHPLLMRVEVRVRPGSAAGSPGDAGAALIGFVGRY